MTRASASDAVRRLLVLVPWVASHPDGAPIADICERFAISESRLRSDLAILPFVGVAPFTHDALVDLWFDEDRVHIQPQWFDRPLRLTTAQGLALVLAAESLASVPGADPDGPLPRALEKVGRVLGPDTAAVLEVELGRADPEVFSAVRAACEGHRALVIEYYAYGRDQVTSRVVEPWSVFVAQGHWYLSAHCRAAGDERLFRVDRIRSATVLDEVVEPPAEPVGTEVFHPGPEGARVVVDLTPEAAWVLDAYPVEVLERRDDGSSRVAIDVGATRWYVRLALQLGRTMRLVEGPDEIVEATSTAARRILARYRDTGSQDQQVPSGGPEASATLRHGD